MATDTAVIAPAWLGEGSSRRALLEDVLDVQKLRPHVEYQDRPIDWLVDKLGFKREHIVWSEYPEYEDHEWDGSRDPLVGAFEALARWEWAAVEAGTGTSKTYTLGAGGMLWFLACWENARVVTLAPKEDQLTKNLWKEVSELWPAFERHFPGAKLQSLSLRMRGGINEKWAATGFVAGVGAEETSAKRARGFHEEHMLFIVEEAPGVHDAIWAAIKNTSTAPHNLILALGNPDHQQDPLHRFSDLAHVRHFRISAFDYPNVVLDNPSEIPGGVSRISIERMAEDWGEGSRMFERMVRGISPAQAEDALIRWEWCEEAAARYGQEEYLFGPPALGVDVARSESGNKAAKAFWKGATLREILSFPCSDTVDLGKQVAVDIALRGIDPMHVGVDSVGVGGGTVDKLKELQVHVQALNAGDPQWIQSDQQGAIPVRLVEKFANLRSQMWWQMAMDLQRGRIALPDDKELWQDLCTPVYWTHNGKIYVEPKEDIVKRLKRSPDKGDAAVMSNWVRPREKEEYEERDISAWDPEILEREAREGRRLKPGPARKSPGEELIHPEFGALL